jgi:hypothetical protein
LIACTSRVASFAARIRELALERVTALRAEVLVATFGWMRALRRVRR